MHILDVIGHPGHQAADRIAGKKFNCQILYMIKEPHPQIVHDHVTAVFHNHFLGKIENEIKKYDCQEDSCHYAKTRDIILAQNF